MTATPKAPDAGRVKPLDRSGPDKSTWTLCPDMLIALRKESGEWAEYTDLETVEAIALAVEARILSALEPAPGTPKAPGAVVDRLLDELRAAINADLEHAIEWQSKWFERAKEHDAAIKTQAARIAELEALTAPDAAIRAAALEEAANAQSWEAFVKDDAPMYLSDWQRGLVAGQNAVRAAIRALIEKGPTE